MSTSKKIPLKTKAKNILKAINVEPAIFLVYLNSGILEIPHRDLVLTKTCTAGSALFGNSTFDPDICSNLTNYPDIQKQVQEIISKKSIIDQIIYNPILILVAIFAGNWCDHGGKKTLLIINLIGRLFLLASLLVNFVIKDLVIEFFWMDIPFFIAGGETTCFIVAYAIVSDDTSDLKKRSIRILIIASLWHIGTAIGNLFSGYILEYGTFYAIDGTSTFLVLLSLIYTIFMVKTKQPKGESFSYSDIFSLKGLWNSILTTFKKRPNNLRHILIIVMVSACLCQFTWGTRFVGVDYYYVRRNFQWPEISKNPTFPVTWLSQYYTMFDIPQTVAVFTIFPILTNVFHFHDATLSILGMLSVLASKINFSMASSRDMLYFNVGLGIFLAAETPGLRSILTKIVEPDEIGKVLAIMSVSMQVGSLCWPLISLVYAATLDMYLGTVYLFMAGVTCVVILNTLYVYSYLKRVERKKNKTSWIIPSYKVKDGKTDVIVPSSFL